MQQHQQTRVEQAQQAAAACARVLKERYGVRQVHLFGSLAGQGPWHSHSDIDLAVEGLAPERYFRALSELWDLLPEGMELDLITLEDAPPEMVKKVRSSSIDISSSESDDTAELVARMKEGNRMPLEAREDPKESLNENIQGELASLGRITEEAKQLLERMPKKPSFIEIRAAGSIVHDFYSGIERIFERIAITLGPGLPVAGPGWHTVLLQSMETTASGIRSAVIDHGLALRLLDYLRFRHLFRHSYGYDLQWEKLRPLVESLEDMLVTTRHQLEQFINSLIAK